MSKKTEGPATPSMARERMLPMWQQMDAVLGGTENMRAARQTYMPQHLGEEDDRYNERIKTAVLWNQTELTLNGWVGRPFRSPLKLNEDVPENIQHLSGDIDRQGTNMDTFARRWFRAGIAKAFCHVLIESPKFVSEDPNKKPTLADERQQGIRPYWVLVEPDEVIAARAVVENGKEVLTHLRVMEVTAEVDPDDRFSEVLVERIRVYDRTPTDVGPVVSVSVYRYDTGLDEWFVESTSQLDIDVIPLVTFYADRQGFLLGKSPLQDLSDLNVQHWQSQSDQDSILRIARFPILAASGVDDGSDPMDGTTGGMEKAITGGKKGTIVAPYRILATSDPQGKYYYVEHTGKAIKSGQESLDKLEAKMSAYGSEFLKKSPDRQTATARTLDSAESVSPLQAITLNFVDAFQHALAMTAKWLGEEPQEDSDEYFGGTITVVTEFGPEEVSGIDLSTLITARQVRDISRETFLEELKRRGVLADTFDFDRNQEQVEKEAMDLLSSVAPPAPKLPNQKGEPVAPDEQAEEEQNQPDE